MNKPTLAELLAGLVEASGISEERCDDAGRLARGVRALIREQTLCYEGDCAKMTGRARPCPIHDRAPAQSEEATALLARANCLLLSAHPIVARSNDQGLRGAINHHLKQRECGFDDTAGPGPSRAPAQPAAPTPVCPHCTSPDGHCPWHKPDDGDVSFRLMRWPGVVTVPAGSMADGLELTLRPAAPAPVRRLEADGFYAARVHPESSDLDHTRCTPASGRLLGMSPIPRPAAPTAECSHCGDAHAVDLACTRQKGAGMHGLMVQAERILRAFSCYDVADAISALLTSPSPGAGELTLHPAAPEPSAEPTIPPIALAQGRELHILRLERDTAEAKLAAVRACFKDLPSPDELRADKRLTRYAKETLAYVIEGLTAPSPGAGEKRGPDRCDVCDLPQTVCDELSCRGMGPGAGEETP